MDFILQKYQSPSSDPIWKDDSDFDSDDAEECKKNERMIAIDLNELKDPNDIDSELQK